MPANLENSAMATGLEKVSFHSDPKERQCQRIDTFELWCWRKLLRVPWTARRSNQSILKEISPGCSLEWLMPKLKFQYFGRLKRRADSFEKTLILVKIEGKRRRGRQRMRWLDGIPTQWTWVWADSGSWWWTGRPGVLLFMGLQKVGHDWATELNWTDYPRIYNTFKLIYIYSQMMLFHFMNSTGFLFLFF